MGSRKYSHVMRAACLSLMRMVLTPVAVKGLSSSVLGRRYFPKAHPRLDAIIHSREPVRFDADCSLPDPLTAHY